MQKIRTLVTAALCTLVLAAPALADSGKGAMKNMDMKGMNMKGGQMGEMVHQSTVESYGLAYHLIDMQAKMKEKKGMNMKGMDMSKMTSHHLMVYLTGPDGQPATGAKVGFKVTGPDGADQKAMAMEMKGAYGANLNFSAKGTYTVKTKIMASDKKLLDQFTYEVK